MPELGPLTDRSYRALLAREARYEREVAAALRSALNDMRAELTVIYEKYSDDGTLSLADMTRYNRLRALEDDVLQTMDAATRASVGTIRTLRPEQYGEAFFRYGWSIDQASGLRLRWGALNRDAIVASLDNRMYQIAVAQYRADARAQILRALNSGLAAGKSYPDMARDLKHAINTTMFRATRIIRTEGQTAIQAGADAAYTRAGEEGVEMAVVWDATLDGDTRPTHGAMDGQTRGDDGYFDGPGGERAPYPAWEGLSAGERINCFPADTLIQARGVEKAYRRWYSGPMVTVKTAGGIELRATPNHPVLTPNGWVAISQLEHGDYVVSMSGFDGGCARYPHEYRKPVMIGKVFKLLQVVGARQRVVKRRVNFHGDGEGSDVEVVTIDSLLMNAWQSFAQQLKQFMLTMTNVLQGVLSCLGSGHQLFMATADSADRSMGGGGKALAFYGRGVGHPDAHRLTPVAPHQATLLEPSVQCDPRNAKIDGKVLDRLAGNVTLERIVNIETTTFNGHVYNLQTVDEHYIARTENNGNSGVVVHNCRCTLRPEIEGYAPSLRRTRDEGVVPYQTYEQWKQGHATWR